MTQSYSQIQKQIEVLKQKAEKLRSKEIEAVVGRIQVAIGHYGLTPEQLFGPKRAQGKPKSAAPASTRAKYSDGQGNSWSGMGKRPYWLRDALDAGRTLEEFATGSPATSASGKKAKSKAKPRRKSKASYSDGAGHTWSGMGPRPRWLKEAIAAGKTLEQLTA